MEIVMQLPSLPPRRLDSHKGTFGRVLVVAGSRGMSGAAVLCARAALHGGAGLVRLAVPASIQPIVAVAEVCYTTIPLPENTLGQAALAAAAVIRDYAADNDVVALGPGLGQSGAMPALVRSLSGAINRPMVLDADGLNALAGQPEQLRRRPAPTILTPHPGEMARLLGIDGATVQAERRAVAAEFAAAYGVVVVLKGHGTVVTDGRRLYVNSTGNPGMATGGTGDVLTGLIAAFLGQGMDPFAAAQLAVHVHGLAGDLARDAMGEPALTAADVLRYLPAALRNFS
ncbi:MAG: NAD(P)H-hydrate dehydratase [Gemmataceae bacterium]|nr:NAD(P)H-hydrate dehydratase [Gemmataceae bacterium]MDW8265667.1 NAD(P)H-hydrate dehydratase [Gemmataceae bacterium]